MKHESGTDNRLLELMETGFVAELDMSSALRTNDEESIAAWSRRSPEVRGHIRSLHRFMAHPSVDEASVEHQLAKSVLRSLARTFSLVVTRHAISALDSPDDDWDETGATGPAAGRHTDG